MKTLALSLAATLVAASVGVAEAQQSRAHRSSSSPALQDNTQTGRSVGVQNQNGAYDATGDRSAGFEPLPAARGPFQVY